MEEVPVHIDIRAVVSVPVEDSGVVVLEEGAVLALLEVVVEASLPTMTLRVLRTRTFSTPDGVETWNNAGCTALNLS